MRKTTKYLLTCISAALLTGCWSHPPAWAKLQGEAIQEQMRESLATPTPMAVDCVALLSEVQTSVDYAKMALYYGDNREAKLELKEARRQIDAAHARGCPPR